MPKPPPTPDQIKELERIVSRQPGSRFFAPLAEAYLDQGRTNDATEVARRGLAENPGFARGLSVYARALYEAGQKDEASKVYVSACAQHPKESSLRAEWGILLARHGDNPGARAALEDALRINSLDFEARRALDALPEATNPGDDLIVEEETTAARYDTDPPTNVLEPPAQIRNLPVKRTKSGSIPILSAPPVPPPEFETAPTNVVQQQGTQPIAPTPSPPPRPAGKPPQGGPRAAAARDARLARARSKGSARKSARLRDQEFIVTEPSQRITLPSPYRPYWIAGGVVAVGLVISMVWWRGRTRDVDRMLGAAHELYAHDTADALEAAEGQLAHTSGSRAKAQLATIAATRFYRFGAADARAIAESASADAVRAGASLGERSLAETLLRLSAGDVAGAVDLAEKGAKDTPGDPRARMALGLTAQAQGRLGVAEEAFATALAYDRSWLWPAIELARVQRRRGRLEAARTTIAETLLREPRHVAARAEKVAIDAQAAGSPDELELAALDHETGAAPGAAAELASARGRLAMSRGQSEAAREALTRALQLQPGDLEYAWLSGRAELLPGGDVARALPALERAVPPSATETTPQKLDLADAELRAGRAQAARAALEGIESERAQALLLAAAIELDDLKTVDHLCQPSAPALDDEQLLGCAEWAVNRGQTSRAQRLLVRISRNDLKAYADGLLRLGEGSPEAAVELLAGERARLARVRAETAIGHAEAALSDSFAAERETAGAWAARAQVALMLAENGNNAAAMTFIDRALASRPDSPAAVSALAEALAAVGSPQPARKLVDAALAQHPQSARLFVAQGTVAIAAGDAEGAVKACAAALAHDPALPRAHGCMVSAALAAGDGSRAAAAAKTALATSPDAATAAALAYARAGAIDAAEALIVHAVHSVSGPAAQARLRSGTLAIARVGLASDDARVRRHARRLVEKAEHDRGAAAFAVYLLARTTDREQGLHKALPLYRDAFERDSALADAALRAGLAMTGDTHTLEDGVTYLHQYLRLVKTGEGAERAHKELARLGREPR